MYLGMSKNNFESILEIKVLKQPFLKNVSLEEAHSNHTNIFGHAPSSAGASAYKALVKEVLSR